MNIKYAIEIDNLSYQYEKDKKILHNISLRIPEQTVTTILGKNGVGKTTLLNCLLRFLEDYEGKIVYYGKEQLEYTRKELAKIVGLVPQLSHVEFNYTVEEFVLMGCSPSINYFSVPGKDMYNIVEDALKRLEIVHLKSRNINSLSGGEKQLVYIARVLAQNPKIIILDEPTSALDFGNSLKIINLIKQLKDNGYTIILTCHNPDYPFVFQGYTIAMMPDGTTCFGESEKILTNDSLSKMYSVDIERVYLENHRRYICIDNNKTL